MKKQKVRDLDDHEITQQLKEMDDQLFRSEVPVADGTDRRSEEDPQIKKDRARIYTILRERELAGETK